ncbi:hypothetical protein ABIC27_001096 [Streptomyces sp. PvR034]
MQVCWETASFVVPAEAQVLPEVGRAIGIDWGVKQTVTTTSEAHDLSHPEHGKRTSGRSARYQRPNG